MRRAVFATVLVVICCANSVAPVSAQAAPLTGRIVQAGRCPVPLGATDDACPERPFQTTVVIQTPDGQPVTTVLTGEDGTFAVNVPNGQYEIEPLLADGNPPSSDPIFIDVPIDASVAGVTIRITGGSAIRE
jgi:hypothetical protein